MAWLCKVAKWSATLTPNVVPGSSQNLVHLRSAGVVMLTQVRNTSFFTKHTAEQLWKGVTSVSNAGKKRGRGKGSGELVCLYINKTKILCRVQCTMYKADS